MIRPALIPIASGAGGSYAITRPHLAPRVRIVAREVLFMAQNVGGDPFVIIRIEGMHCHKCEQAIQKSLTRLPGVHEVEVDFNSAQASVIYDQNQVTVKELTEAVAEAGYVVSGFTQRQHASDRAGQSSAADQ
jgi:Cu+-exporting ATPase